MTTLKEVAPNLAFNSDPLMEYLRAELGMDAPLEKLLQFEGGQSNPTYLLDIGGEKFVLRRKPPGVLLPSAHAIDREYRIIKALQHSDVPVPEALILCEDDSVIGSAFFLMRYVEGRVFDQVYAEGVSFDHRRALFGDMGRVLAALHKVDFQKIGLGDYGKTEDYIARQVSRWTKQYRGSETSTIDAMNKLIEHLPLHIPKASSVGIVHGDFRLGNLIFHPTEPKVVAVLDWEISTLGDPVSDLAYNCIDYYLQQPRGFIGLDLEALGVPTQKERFDAYFRLVGREPLSNDDWNYYIAFNLFRLAAIVQGVYARGLKGNASSREAQNFGAMVAVFAEAAWRKLS